jgi:GT2 family glycosyltransferase
MKFAFVCTNFYNSNITINFVESLISSVLFDQNSHYIVIVDNSVNQNETLNLQNIISKYPFVILISNKENVGYFPGLNIGLKYIRKKYPDLDNILIGNNDLTFDNDFFIKLYQNNELFKQYPVISPDIVTLDNVHQNPHVQTRVSFFRELFLDLYFSNFFVAKVLMYAKQIFKILFVKKISSKHLEEGEILQGYGACYFLTPVFFKYYDSLFAPTFLMAEEAFLTIQLHKVGFNVFYTPKIKVNHIDHASVSLVDLKKFWQISSNSHKIYRSLISRTNNKKLSYAKRIL